ncbi:MAG: M28 family peptidase [Planctomycetota bacterium]
MKAIIVCVLVLLGALALGLFYCSNMPGQSPPTSTAALTPEESEISENLQTGCEELAHLIGQRNTIRMQGLDRSREFIARRLGRSNLRLKETAFTSRGEHSVNLEVQIEGTSAKDQILVVGAHYDTASYSPGAGDNASGVVMLLEIARLIAARPHERTIQLVFFDRGSGRFAGTDDTGSYAWATEAKRQNMKIAAMISIDSIGMYLDEPGSQGGPFPLNLCYPDQGNFVFFAGDFGSRQLVQACVQNLRTQGGVPCEGITLPGFLPWLAHSDHYPFAQNDWPSLIVTDTGPMRNTEQGEMTDTFDRLNYPRMAMVTSRLVKLIERLSQRSSSATGSLN